MPSTVLLFVRRWSFGGPEPTLFGCNRRDGGRYPICNLGMRPAARTSALSAKRIVEDIDWSINYQWLLMLDF